MRLASLRKRGCSSAATAPSTSPMSRRCVATGCAAAERAVRFDVVSLRLFVAAADQQSIAAESQREHMVQSGVSKRLAWLEVAVGVQLLFAAAPRLVQARVTNARDPQ